MYFESAGDVIMEILITLYHVEKLDLIRTSSIQPLNCSYPSPHPSFIPHCARSNTPVLYTENISTVITIHVFLYWKNKEPGLTSSLLKSAQEKSK